jgi:tetratricopeptide (TPR) repeat protein
MRVRTLVVFAAVSFAASPAFASFSGGKDEDAKSSTSSSSSSLPQVTPRQEAERWYSDAYDEIAKAKKEIAEGKTKNLEKRWQRALERGQRAIELDAKYPEALNLIGYASRMLGRHADAIAAYEKCLVLKPDYAAAHEYLGEAYVELGKPKEARLQLATLEKLGAGEDAKTLRAAIEAYEAKHPAPPEAEASSGGK